MFSKFAKKVCDTKGPQAIMDKLWQIVWADLTKWGRMSQTDVNVVAEYIKGALAVSPETSIAVIFPPVLASSQVNGGLRGEFRRLEDKLVTTGLEIKTVTIPLNLSTLNGNSETPTAFVAWLAVLDSARSLDSPFSLGLVWLSVSLFLSDCV